MAVNPEQVYDSYNFLINQTEYNFSFSVNDITLDENNVIVFLSKTDYPSNRDENVLVLETDYNITFEPSGVGGLVTLIDPSTLPADFEYIIILRSIPYEQPISFPEFYDSTTSESVADNLERQIQQNRSSIESNHTDIEKNKIKVNPPNEAGRHIKIKDTDNNEFDGSAISEDNTQVISDKTIKAPSVTLSNVNVSAVGSKKITFNLDSAPDGSQLVYNDGVVTGIFSNLPDATGFPDGYALIVQDGDWVIDIPRKDLPLASNGTEDYSIQIVNGKAIWAPIRPDVPKATSGNPGQGLLVNNTSTGYVIGDVGGGGGTGLATDHNYKIGDTLGTINNSHFLQDGGFLRYKSTGQKVVPLKGQTIDLDDYPELKELLGFEDDHFEYTKVTSNVIDISDFAFAVSDYNKGICVSKNGNYFLTSDGGKTWTEYRLQDTYPLLTCDISFDGTTYVIGGTAGRFLISFDGLTFNGYSTGKTGNITTSAFNSTSSTLILADNASNIFTYLNKNFDNSSIYTTGFTDQIQHVKFSPTGTLCVACGDNGLILESTQDSAFVGWDVKNSPSTEDGMGTQFGEFTEVYAKNNTTLASNITRDTQIFISDDGIKTTYSATSDGITFTDLDDTDVVDFAALESASNTTFNSLIRNGSNADIVKMTVGSTDKSNVISTLPLTSKSTVASNNNQKGETIFAVDQKTVKANSSVVLETDTAPEPVLKISDVDGEQALITKNVVPTTLRLGTEIEHIATLDDYVIRCLKKLPDGRFIVVANDKVVNCDESQTGDEFFKSYSSGVIHFLILNNDGNIISDFTPSPTNTKYTMYRTVTNREKNVPLQCEVIDNLCYIVISGTSYDSGMYIYNLDTPEKFNQISFYNLCGVACSVNELLEQSFKNSNIIPISSDEYLNFSCFWGGRSGNYYISTFSTNYSIYNKTSNQFFNKQILTLKPNQDRTKLNNLKFNDTIYMPEDEVQDTTEINSLYHNFGNATPRYLTKTKDGLEGCLITFFGSSFGNTRPKDQRTTNMEGMIYSCGFVSNPTDYPSTTDTPGISYFDLGKTFIIKKTTKDALDVFCQSTMINDYLTPEQIDQAYGIFDNGILDIQVVHNPLKSFIIIVPASRIDRKGNTVNLDDTVSVGGFFFAEWTQAQKDADEFPTEYDFCLSVDTLPLISTASGFSYLIGGEYFSNIPGKINIIRQNNDREFYLVSDLNLYPERGSPMTVTADSKPEGSPYTLKEFVMNWDCALGSFFFGGIDNTDVISRKYISKVRFDENGDLLKTGVVNSPLITLDVSLNSYIETYDLGFINPTGLSESDVVEVTSAYHANLAGVSLANMDITDEGLYMTAYEVVQFEHGDKKIQKAINNKIVFIPNSNMPERAITSSILQANTDIGIKTDPAETGTRGIPLPGYADYDTALTIGHQTPKPTFNDLPKNIIRKEITLLDDESCGYPVVFNGLVVITAYKQLIVETESGDFTSITNDDLQECRSSSRIFANDNYLFVFLTYRNPHKLLVMNKDFDVVNVITSFPSNDNQLISGLGFGDNFILWSKTAAQNTTTISFLTNVFAPIFRTVDQLGNRKKENQKVTPFYYNKSEDILYMTFQDLSDSRYSLYKSTDSSYLSFNETNITIDTTNTKSPNVSIVYAEGNDICFTFGGYFEEGLGGFTKVDAPIITYKKDIGSNQYLSNTGLGALIGAAPVLKTDHYYVFTNSFHPSTDLAFVTLSILPLTSSLARERKYQEVSFKGNTFGDYLGGKQSIIDSDVIESNPQTVLYIGNNIWGVSTFIGGAFKISNNVVKLLTSEPFQEVQNVGGEQKIVFKTKTFIHTLDLTPQDTSDGLVTYNAYTRDASKTYTNIGINYINCYVTEDLKKIFVSTDGLIYIDGLVKVNNPIPLKKVLKFLEFNANTGIFILAETIEDEYVIYTSFNTNYQIFSVNYVTIPDNITILNAGLDVLNSDNVAPTKIFIQTDKGVYEADILEDIPNSDFKFITYSDNYTFVCGSDSTVIRRENNNYFTTLFEAEGTQFNTIAAASANDVFVTGEQSFKSSDDGLTWTLYDDGITDVKTNIQTTSDTTDPSLLLAGGNLYRSTTNWDNYNEIISAIGSNVNVSYFIRGQNRVFFANQRVVVSGGLNDDFDVIKNAEDDGYVCTTISYMATEPDSIMNVFVFYKDGLTKIFYTINDSLNAVFDNTHVPIFASASSITNIYYGGLYGNVYPGSFVVGSEIKAGTNTITTMTFSPDIIGNNSQRKILFVGNDVGELYKTGTWTDDSTFEFFKEDLPTQIIATSKFISSSSGMLNTLPATLKSVGAYYYSFVTEDTVSGATQLLHGQLGSFVVKDNFAEEIYCTRIQDDPNYVLVVAGGNENAFISYSIDNINWEVIDIPFLLKPVKAFEINKNILIGSDISGSIFSIRFYPDLGEYTVANSVYHGREALQYLFAETNKNPITKWQTINVNVTGYTTGKILSKGIAYYGIGDITIIRDTGEVGIAPNPSTNEITCLTEKYYGYNNGDVYSSDGTLFHNYGSLIQAVCVFKDVLFVSTLDGKLYQDKTQIVNPFDTFVGSNIITAIDTNNSMLVLCNTKMNIATTSTIGTFDVVYKDNVDNIPLNDIAFAGEKVFVCGNQGVILVGDVDSFDLRTTGFDENVVGITYLKENLFCLESTNRIISSRDEFSSVGVIETLALEDIASNAVDIGVLNNNIVATATDSSLNVKIIITTSD